MVVRGRRREWRAAAIVVSGGFLEILVFVAVYWWRVHPGKEEQFRSAWRRGTELITQRYGSYGSRLHRETDGRFVAYAEWPDEQTWRMAFEAKMHYDEPETRRRFVEAIAETPPDNAPVFTMTVTDDLLERAPRRQESAR